MGFLAGFLAGALNVPPGERRYIYDRGRYDGQLRGRQGGGFDVFDGRGLYERTIK